MVYESARRSARISARSILAFYESAWASTGAGSADSACLARVAREVFFVRSARGICIDADLRYAIDEHGVASALWKSRESSRAFPRAVWRMNETISRALNGVGCANKGCSGN